MVDNSRTECYHLETINLGIVKVKVKEEPTYPTLVLVTLLPMKGSQGSLNLFEIKQGTVTLPLPKRYILGVKFHIDLTKKILYGSQSGTQSVSYTEEAVPLIGFTNDNQNFPLGGELQGTLSVSEEQLKELERLAKESNPAPMLGIRRSSQWVKISISDKGEKRPHLALHDKAMSDIIHVAS
jgi:hypothetical protein